MESRREMIYRAFIPDTARGAEANVDLAMETWSKVFRSFTPLIGDYSVRMIFARTLDLVKPAYPWLERESLVREGESLEFLRQRIRGRELGETLDACRALLQTFCDILEALIGIHLTSLALQTALAPPCPSDRKES